MPKICANDTRHGKCAQGVASPMNVLCPRIVWKLSSLLAPISTGSTLRQNYNLVATVCVRRVFHERLPSNDVHATIFVPVSWHLRKPFPCRDRNISYAKGYIALDILE